MKPIRIQRRRTKGWRMPENTVYVGRESKFGNPYFVYANKFKDHKHDLNPYCFSSHGRAVAGFRFQLELLKHHSPKCVLRFDIAEIKAELKGKNLACWCPIKKNGLYVPCHADILLAISNE